MLGLGPFETKVVGLACVILIIALSIVGYLLAKAKHASKPWPPTIAVCPDYWEDKTGTGKHCTNPHNLGKCAIGEIPPDGVDLTFLAQPKNRCYASLILKDNCDLSWDGITNDDNACASSSASKKSSSSSPTVSYLAIFAVVIVFFGLMYLLTKRYKKE